MNEIAHIGEDLVRARRARGLTQKDLGALLGVKQQQIARWEAVAYRTVALERVADVAGALDVTAASSPAGEWLAAEDRAAYEAAPAGASPEAITALRRIGVSPGILVAFARSHGVRRLDLFGSVLGAGFGPASDVDVLVAYETGRTPGLMGSVDYELELSAIVRRKVDLVSRAAVESSPNRVRRTAILSSARCVYAAG